jgi:outer membrane lipopolysaccharide assembly protein LptE/RlpB
LESEISEEKLVMIETLKELTISKSSLKNEIEQFINGKLTLASVKLSEDLYTEKRHKLKLAKEEARW